MGFAAAHRLREIECAILSLASESFEAAVNEEIQAIGKEIPAKKLSSVNLAQSKLFELSNLLNEAVARYGAARCAELLNRCYWHGPACWKTELNYRARLQLAPAPAARGVGTLS
jgi:hypothetical protein